MLPKSMDVYVDLQDGVFLSSNNNISTHEVFHLFRETLHTLLIILSLGLSKMLSILVRAEVSTMYIMPHYMFQFH